MSPLEKMFTVENIANMTSLTTRTIRNYLKDGSLKGRKIGGQWRFTEEDVMNFMNQSNVISSLNDVATQSVYDFIDGVNTDIQGTTQTCSIVDLYTDIETATAKGNAICELINTNTYSDDCPIRFSQSGSTDDTTGEFKARFIIYGPPEFLIKVYELLK